MYNRKNENIIILSIFVAMLVLLVVVNVTPVKKISRMRISNPFQTKKLIIAPVKKPSAQSAEEGLLYYVDAEGTAGDWSRDLFSYVKETASDVFAFSQYVEQDPQLELTLILISGAEKTATINGRIYRTGDLVGGELLTAITKNSVVLELEGEQRTEYLRSNDVNIYVEEQQ
ncbi:MAG: general secretion pathway protein GspB [Deltaproteobacteria bacterium]|nr:general secretion pathway protein GspB [Deltaproteobacteria bacterium]